MRTDPVLFIERKVLFIATLTKEYANDATVSGVPSRFREDAIDFFSPVVRIGQGVLCLGVYYERRHCIKCHARSG